MIDIEKDRGRRAKARRRLGRTALTSASALLLAGTAMPLHAGSTAAAAETQPEQQNPEIIVTAPSLFRDVRPERTLDEAGVASYGLSTIDELIAEIQLETGDDEDPVFVVNGERVYDLDDIGAYPVEVIRQLQVLPRGSATRVGGSPRQRVISLSLHRQMRSATVLMAPRLATDGNAHAARGETIFTHVRGQSRGNVTLRARDENALLESQRGIIQPLAQLPYAANGNIIAYPDLSGEIDPLLSNAAGEIVTVVPVPSSQNPTLADFAAVGNEVNVTDLGLFRTLRPALRSYDLNASYTAPLASWLTSTATLRLSRSTSRSRLGLPAGIFVLDSLEPFSPFSVPVGLAFYGGEPLRSRYRRQSAEANVTMTARLGGGWRAVFNGKHSLSNDVSRTERTASSAPVALGAGVDPFGSALGELIPVTTNVSRSRYATTTAQASVTGSPLRLPAGDATVTAEGRLAWRSVRSESSFSDEPRNLRRSEQAIRGVIDVPIASPRNDFLAEIGELSASAEYSLLHFSDAGNAHRRILGLTWEPRGFLRLRGSVEQARQPASIELLGAAESVTPSVRVFDFLTGDTVDVLYVSGGNPALVPETIDTHRLSWIVRLMPSLGLQLNGEYSDSRTRNSVSSLPPASEAIMLAFPDRFIRDPNGVLVSVDVRPVNFAEQRQRRLRYGLSLSAPLGAGSGDGGAASAPSGDGEGGDSAEEAAAATVARASATGPRTRLQLTANHSVVLQDEVLVRPGLAPIDLLDGGAIGIAGGRTRHELDATAAVTSGGTGIRLGASWRGGNVLQSRINGTAGLLRFSPLMRLNLRVFADAERLFPASGFATGTRFSLNVTNLTNQRQQVRDAFGATPLQYQPGYRDAIGRTVEFELRRVF